MIEREPAQPARVQAAIAEDTGMRPPLPARLQAVGQSGIGGLIRLGPRAVPQQFDEGARQWRLRKGVLRKQNRVLHPHS
jgi:hypothetical protein